MSTTESKKNKLPIRIRAAANEDIGFIFNSWLKSYRNAQYVNGISNTIYFSSHHKLIEQILIRSNVQIACSQEDPSQIYGYSVSEKMEGFLVVHYVYVKHPFRNLGIGNSLLQTSGYDPKNATINTHSTDLSRRVQGKYNLVFHPYLAYNPALILSSTKEDVANTEKEKEDKEK